MRPSLLAVLCTAVMIASAVRVPLPHAYFPREPNVTLQTPLDQYVWTYDSDAGYEIYTAQTYRGRSWTGYVLNFTSGSWKPKVSSRPIWQHWLTIIVPDQPKESVALMYIDGPSNQPAPDAQLNLLITMLAGNLPNSVIVYLQQVPNEDIRFPDLDKNLGEDWLIGYTWRKFFNESGADPTWLLRLPMTRAAVNAMTVAGDYIAHNHPNVPPISGFLVAGASKRGWTTWTTAAVDTRVVAAVPIVMPIPEMVPNIASEWRAYGNWSFALKPYEYFGVFNYLFATPVGAQAIADIVGPGRYLDRLTIPVWNIIAAGDEFTLPDSPRFWWNKLPGEKHLRVVPNAEHAMICCAQDVIADISSFYLLFVNKIPRPTLNFTLQYAGSQPNDVASITLSTTSTAPVEVTMWWAITIPGTGLRDFRLVICEDIKNPSCWQEVVWLPEKLKRRSDGTWIGTQRPPAIGWTGFLLQANFDVPNPNTNGTISWRITTEVNIVPDTFPFPACPASVCNNPFPPSNASQPAVWKKRN